MINKSQKQEKAKKTLSNQRKTKENITADGSWKISENTKTKKCNETWRFGGGDAYIKKR